jgi:hypothetical protein
MYRAMPTRAVLPVAAGLIVGGCANEIPTARIDMPNDEGVIA